MQRFFDFMEPALMRVESILGSSIGLKIDVVHLSSSAVFGLSSAHSRAHFALPNSLTAEHLVFVRLEGRRFYAAWAQHDLTQSRNFE